MRKRFYPLVVVIATFAMAFMAMAPYHVLGQDLGCQKNNPDRLDCSSLSVSGVCDGGTAVFTVTNTGEPGNGDMRAATQYRLVVDGSVVEAGSIQLAGGTTMQITYSGGGSVTLEADQQVGHPGNSHPRMTLDCAPAPTEETPTELPPTEATPTQDITPTEPPATEVTATEPPPTEVTPDITPTDDVTPEITPTEEITPEVTPTDEVTPEIDPTDEVEPTEAVTPESTPEVPNLGAEGTCDENGLSTFVITNFGADTIYSIHYAFYDEAGTLLDEGYLDLTGGERSSGLSLSAPGTAVTFTVNYGLLDVFLPPCVEATPEPTFEPTVETTAAPTEEPTQIPTQTATPAPSPTPFGCQKNNPGRLDCSSLQVTATCQGSIAVFTITNTGTSGNGDMVAATQYRLIRNNTVIETAPVQLPGGGSMQIFYVDDGRVTLEADQQIGHPGKSQPQATINCRR